MSVDPVMTEFWRALYAQQRRALAVFAYCDELADRLLEAPHGFIPWSELATVERMRIVRALPHLAELAIAAAATLRQAGDSLRQAAGPTLRESLTQQIADTVGLPVETIERGWKAARRREGR